ncbi:MAG: hypothetical protein KTR31_30885 [Myxococcales bacterium]|nr:hypothetical protein [Myxococcales bacterium]
MKRWLTAAWAVLLLGGAVVWSQGCLDGADAPTSVEAEAGAEAEAEPVLMPATKADAGEGARQKKAKGNVGRRPLMPATKSGLMGGRAEALAEEMLVVEPDEAEAQQQAPSE